MIFRNNLLPIITTVINLVLTFIVSMIMNNISNSFKAQKKAQKKAQIQQENENIAIKSAMLAILKDRLYTNCFRVLNLGEITVEDRENIESIHSEYKNLGGNHTGDDLFKRVMTLKIVEEYKNEIKR